MNAVIDTSVPASPESVPAVRRDVVAAYEQGGGDPLLSADVALAVTEAAANAIRHAYPQRGDGRITVRGWFEDGLFIVQVLDRGVGIDTPTRDPGAHLGIALIEQLADAQFALREGGGTEARLAFPLVADAWPAQRTAPLPAFAALQLAG
ncbi:MAG TPA: ATP-binding protein [Gaiellales bacterium]|nr:ATP-binding protein [Gaiellales bacterium]